MIKYHKSIKFKLISHNPQYILIRFLENIVFTFIQENQGVLWLGFMPDYHSRLNNRSWNRTELNNRIIKYSSSTALTEGLPHARQGCGSVCMCVGAGWDMGVVGQKLANGDVLTLIKLCIWILRKARFTQ